MPDLLTAPESSTTESTAPAAFDPHDVQAPPGSTLTPDPPPDFPPSALMDLVQDSGFQSLQPEQRQTALQRVGMGVHSYLQKQPDSDHHTAELFAQLYSHAAEHAAPPQAQGILGSILTPIKEHIVPNIAGTAAGIGAAAATSGTGPGAIVADLAASDAASYAAQKAQDALRGPAAVQKARELEAVNAQRNPISSRIGSLAASIPTMFNPPQWFKKGTKTAAARITSAATGGARMAGIGASSALAAGVPGASWRDIPEETLKGAVTAAPLGLLPAARTLLKSLLVKAPADAAVMTTANALYDFARHGTPINLRKVAGEAGAEIPGFLILNALAHVSGNYRISKTPDPNLASDSAHPPASDMGAAPGEAGAIPAAGSFSPPSTTSTQSTPSTGFSTIPERPPTGPITETALPEPAAPAEKAKLPTAELAKTGPLTSAETAPPSSPPPPQTPASAAPAPSTSEIPSPTVAPPSTPSTSLSFAQVDAERLARGEPLLPTAATQTWTESISRAQQKLRDNPQAAIGLIDELNTRPRPLLAEDSALLLIHRTQLRAQENAKLKIINDPATSDADRQTAQSERAALLPQLEALEEATGRGGSGTEAGRALQILQMFMKEDYSPDSIRRQFRAAKDGKPLTAEETQEAGALSAAVQKTADAIELHEATAPTAELTAAEQTLRQEAAEQELQATLEAGQTFLQTVDSALNDALARIQARKASETPSTPSTPSTSSTQSTAPRQTRPPRPTRQTPTAEPSRPTTAPDVTPADKREASDAAETLVEQSSAGSLIAALDGARIHVPEDWKTKAEWNWLAAHMEGKKLPKWLEPVFSTEHGLNLDEASLGEYTTDGRRDRQLTGDQYGQALADELIARDQLYQQEYERKLNELTAERQAAAAGESFTPFMDATGLLTAASIIRTMARQARDLATFSAHALARFGKWIQPHLLKLWNAARHSATAVHEYLKGAVQAAYKHSERGSNVSDPRQPGPRRSTPAPTAETIDVTDEHIVAASVIVKGVKDFNTFTRRMMTLGIRAWNLKTFYEEAKVIAQGWRSQHATQSRKSAPRRLAPDATQEEAARHYARQHLAAWIKEHGDTPMPLADLVTRTHADLLKAFPDITLRQTRDALSGYGQTTKPSSDQLNKQLTELKSQARLFSAIEDAAQNKAPQKSGFQRGKPTPDVRALQGQLRDLMRQHNIQTTGPEQLASARQSVVSRLKNQITDLTRIIEGKQGPRAPRAPIAYDAEMNALARQRQELQDYVQDLTGPSPELAWNKTAQRAAKASEEYYQRRIAAGAFGKPARPGYIENTDTKAARSQRDAAKAEFDRLREASGIPQAQALTQTKLRLAKRIAEIQHRLITGKKPTPGIPPVLDAEASALKAEADRLRTALQQIEGRPGMSDTARAKAAESNLDRSIALVERQIQEKDFTAKSRGLPPVDSPVLRSKREHLAFLKEIRDAAKEAQTPRRSPEEIALSTLKDRLRKSTAELERKLATGDFSKRSPKEIQLDQEATKLKADNELARLNVKRAIKTKELENSTFGQKLASLSVRVKRDLALASTPIFAKLAMAGWIIRPFTTLFEETFGRLWTRLVLPDVLRNAPGEGGAAGALRSTAAYLSGFGRGIKEISTALKTGSTSNKTAYNKPQLVERKPGWDDYLLGHTHMALKTPAWEAAFSKSEANRMAQAGYEHAGQAPPEQLTQIRKAAAEDANHAIYVNENQGVKLWQGFLGQAEKSSPLGAVAANLLKMESVIIKIPTNLLAEAYKYLFGSIHAPIQRAVWRAKQAGVLTPEQYNTIARNMKKGAFLPAMIALYLAVPGAIQIGGLYREGDRRKHGDLQPDDVIVLGHKLPHNLTHAGIFTAIQAMGTGLRQFQQDREKKASLPAGALDGLLHTFYGLGSNVPFVSGVKQGIKSMGAGPDAEYARAQFGQSFVPFPLKFAAQNEDYKGTDSLWYRLALGTPSHDVKRRKMAGFAQGIQSGIPQLPFIPKAWTRSALPPSKSH